MKKLDKPSQGAWLIHHTQKLDAQTSFGFEQVFLSGKCGMLLSALSADKEKKISKEKVAAIAAANGISTIFELPRILDILKENHLIDVSTKGEVVTLGITSHNVLEHTSNVYEQHKPNKIQNASLLLAELVSQQPIGEKIAKEQIGDELKLSQDEINRVFSHSEDVNFIDAQTVSRGEKLLFNGNLFRVENANKFDAVISSITPADSRRVNELDDLLAKSGCVTYEGATKILGPDLFARLQSIGFYDMSTVANSSENSHFITRPYAFSKYGNSFLEDSMDLAKALVASLAYGMFKSNPSRGKINSLSVLMAKLINGWSVGPADAIGEDYKYLETRGVVSITKSSKYPNAYNMTLLKKEIGEIALRVLAQGQGSEVTLIKGASATSYTTPEKNRVRSRGEQKKNQLSDKQLNEIIRSIRTS